jgi:hypothetical protein
MSPNKALAGPALLRAAATSTLTACQVISSRSYLLMRNRFVIGDVEPAGDHSHLIGDGQQRCASHPLLGAVLKIALSLCCGRCGPMTCKYTGIGKQVLEYSWTSFGSRRSENMPTTD